MAEPTPEQKAKVSLVIFLSFVAANVVGIYDFLYHDGPRGIFTCLFFTSICLFAYFYNHYDYILDRYLGLAAAGMLFLFFLPLTSMKLVQYELSFLQFIFVSLLCLLVPPAVYEVWWHLPHVKETRARRLAQTSPPPSPMHVPTEPPRSQTTLQISEEAKRLAEEFRKR